MELLPAIRKSIIAFALLPALLYAGIPPTLQSDASQRMTKDIMDRAYITPKRIVTKYAGCKNNLIKNEHYLLERGLAYMLTLNKALFLKEQQIKFINYLRNKVIWLYIPIEFQMQEVSDSLRGMNENVRYKTDDNIVRLLGECNIPYYTIHGNMKKRESILDEIMIQYEINKK